MEWEAFEICTITCKAVEVCVRINGGGGDKLPLLLYRLDLLDIKIVLECVCVLLQV